MDMYAYKNREEILEKSSSGGAFMAIAESFFNRTPNGIVFGVVLKGTKVVYESAEKLDDCEKFQESKYIFANPKGIFETIDKHLKNNRPVLFVGLPCIVNGLKIYLKKKVSKSELLFTVDLICHGTGDDRFWNDYVRWIEKKYNSKISKYSFRYKTIGWSGYPVYIQFENGKELIDTYDARIYIRAYLKQFVMREVCTTCKYKSMERYGEITIGDFWGIEKINSQFNNIKGVSLIIANNPRGLECINYIKDHKSKEELLISVDKEQVLERQDNLKGNYVNPDYNRFWEDYKRYGFSDVIGRYGIYNLKGILRYKIILFIKKVGLYNTLISLRKR